MGCIQSKSESSSPSNPNLLLDRKSRRSDDASSTGKRRDVAGSETSSDCGREKSSAEKTEEDMETEVQTMLAHEQKRLRSKAKPMLNKAAAEKVSGLELTEKDVAAMKIQRCARRMLAIAEVKAKQDWLV